MCFAVFIGSPSTEVHFVTWQSSGEPLISRTGNFPDQVANLALNGAWLGTRSKIDYLVSWLSRGIPDDDIVVAMDGGDVIWAGCSKANFLSNYQQIVERTGSPIVFSAEVTCWEQDCRLAEHLNRPKTSDRWFGFTQCPGTPWNDECAERRRCAECGQKPAAEFLNSGFFTGPAKQVYAMAKWAQKNYDDLSTWGDQSVYAVYWNRNPHLVVLDYMSKLVLSLSDVRDRALSVDVADGTVTNNVFGHLQCFIHGNGRGKQLVMNVADQLDPKATSSSSAPSFLRLKGVSKQCVLEASPTSSLTETDAWFADVVSTINRSRPVEVASQLWR